MSAVSLDVTPKGSVEIETLVNGPIQTNSYAVISDNECVIIDPAWEGERLVEHIRAEHPGVRMLGAVCTHGHADHVWDSSIVAGDDVVVHLPEPDLYRLDNPAIHTGAFVEFFVAASGHAWIRPSTA